MKEFLKDNIALVAAIALPAALALVFALSTMFVKVTVESPKNDVLLVTDLYEPNSRFTFGVINDKLTISYLGQQKDNNGTHPRLWRVHVPEMAVEEIALHEPADRQSAEIIIPGITDVKVQNLTPGPDGYSFIDSYSSRNHSLMTEIFSDNSYRYNAGALTKNGRIVEIKMPDGNNWYNTRFIGWIIKDEAR